VFVNALGTDFRIWRDVIVRMVGEFAIVTYDLRGHGLTDAGSFPYSMDDHVSDLEALLDSLGQKDAIICGLSVGGLIAQGLYHKRPDLVRAMALCCTGAKIGTDELWDERIETVMSEGVAGLAEQVMSRYFGEEFQNSNPDDVAGYRNMVAQTSQIGYAGTCAAIKGTDYRSMAGEIDAPVICIAGEEDISTPPELVMELAKSIPNARYELIKNAKHMPSIEQAEMLSEILKAFITSCVVDNS